MSVFAELSPPYATIVADPPWPYRDKPVSWEAQRGKTQFMPYSVMNMDDICALPVRDLAADDAHLYLWTTNRFIWDAPRVVNAWGFRVIQVLVWCKPTNNFPGGVFNTSTTEFVVFARRGSLKAKDRDGFAWWKWARGPHSQKPDAFMDMVERVSPGPYVELFARAPRLGWDSWGLGYESERVS